MDAIEHYDAVDVFIGVDVGKGKHHAVALNRAGKRLFDKAMPNDETRLRALISNLKEHGNLLLVVDQPTTIGALPVTVARAEGILVAYLPGLAMRRIADLHAGEAKTDARDAAIIAEAARSMPHALRSLRLDDERLAELPMLCGFDDDLADQITQTSNRIRGLLTQIHPALERVLGPRLDHPAVLDLLQRHPSPASLAATSEKSLANKLSKLAPRMGKGLAHEVFLALSEQTVIVPGTNAATIVVPRLAHQLAAYAGLAPVTRRSGSSIRGEHPSRRGNKVLKRALFLSAFAALRDPVSRAYYARKISQGKRHNQALIALARRRCDVMYAIMRDGTLYCPNPLQTA